MTLIVEMSPAIIILTTLGWSFTLLENIYNAGITHDDHHYDRHFYRTGHRVEVADSDNHKYTVHFDCKKVLEHWTERKIRA